MSYKKLVDGFDGFQKEIIQSEEKNYYKELLEQGQKPEVLIIGCSDSRIDPAILTNSNPGEFFAIRNVAALVPPYHNGGKLRGTSSAIEYAVRFLNVKHIIVLGHEKCGGVEALATGNYQATHYHNFQFLHDWLNIGIEAKEQVFKELECSSDEKKIRALEQATILTSISNLLTFPWIKSKCDAEELQIHGWYFDMKQGALLEYNVQREGFSKLCNHKQSPHFIKENPSLSAFIKKYAQECTCHS